MKTLSLFLLLLASAASADEGKFETPSPDFQVEVDPGIYPPAEFEGKSVKSGNLPARIKRADALPDRTERESTFGRVPGLARDIAAMDELDRDLLYVRAKNRTLVELKGFYPKITEKKLARLKRETGK